MLRLNIFYPYLCICSINPKYLWNHPMMVLSGIFPFLKCLSNQPETTFSRLPKFMDWEKQLSKYQGLNIIYSNQCPWVARSINKLGEVAKKEGLKLNVTELKNAKDAQNAPSLHATFNLIYNGKLLVDHYISSKRFQNIINKEIK